ncbi:tyrosine-type recombinase/integrase [Faecalibacterium sp. An121]|uniref:tyrosine-type recombinase/integrase n=1 Tax=Faecalibacterium sp. An121 TaxID=1965550 RepID=UPI001FA83F24|nr:tyrosine-type recombinase/integrase [Faecalibacterium sp. An121]
MLLQDVEIFIEHCTEKGLAVKTIASYEQTLRLLIQYLDAQGIHQIDQITHTVIRDYVRCIQQRGKYTVAVSSYSSNCPERRRDYGKKVSPTTINNYLRNMSVFFNWCVEEGLMLRSPIKKGDYLKVERKPLEFVSDEDFRRLLKCMDISHFSEYRDSIIVQLLLDTGMRISECLLIHVTDVDLRKHCIYLPSDHTKGKKGRYVFYSDKMASMLQRWLKYKDRYRDSDFLFCTNQGKPVEVSNFEKNITKYAKRVGLANIHPHVFRNNFAKRFLMNGGDIYTLSRLLGHSSVTITEQAYLDITQDDLAELYRKHSPLNHMTK